MFQGFVGIFLEGTWTSQNPKLSHLEDLPLAGPNNCKKWTFEWITFPETNISPENQWLEDDFPFGMAYFSEAMLVSGRVGHRKMGFLWHFWDSSKGNQIPVGELFNLSNLQRPFRRRFPHLESFFGKENQLQELQLFFFHRINSWFFTHQTTHVMCHVEMAFSSDPQSSSPHLALIGCIVKMGKRPQSSIPVGSVFSAPSEPKKGGSKIPTLWFWRWRYTGNCWKTNSRRGLLVLGAGAAPTGAPSSSSSRSQYPWTHDWAHQLLAQRHLASLACGSYTFPAYPRVAGVRPADKDYVIIPAYHQDFSPRLDCSFWVKETSQGHEFGCFLNIFFRKKVLAVFVWDVFSWL